MIHLFIHHDPNAQPWVTPYLEQRHKVWPNARHIEITGDTVRAAYGAAKAYFGVDGDRTPGVTEVSDWIRLHHLMTVPRLLYSDSDVWWHYAPTLPEVAARGDTTFGVIWNGNRILSRERRESIFAYAKETGMLRFVPSHLFVDRETWIPKGGFYHGKDLDFSPHNQG